MDPKFDPFAPILSPRAEIIASWRVMDLSHASASRRIEGGGCICITLSKLTRKGIAEIVRGVELLAGYPAKNASRMTPTHFRSPNYNVTPNLRAV